jgi:hypothetical protein
MVEKIELTEIDKEHWRFILYENSKKEWIGDFVYSPQSFIDLSMLIKLTNEEKEICRNDRTQLLKLADQIRSNHREFLSRSLDRKKYMFNK